MGNPWQSYGASLAIWDLTVLLTTRHKWMRPAITRANQADTRFTYPGGMEGWVDLGSLIVAWPEIGPTTARSQVRHANHYATENRQYGSCDFGLWQNLRLRYDYDTTMLVNSRPGQYQSCSGTQEIRFGRKTDEIAKFSILEEKNEIHNFGRNLDEKWPTYRRDRRKKVVKFFHIHWHYHNAFIFGLKERMPRIIGMRMD